MGDTARPTFPTRRGFLGLGVAAAGATLLAGCEDPRPKDNGFAAPNALATALPALDPVTALNTVLAIEHEAIFAYTAVAPLLTTAAVAALAAGFLKDHMAHRDALTAKVSSAGGQPVAAKPTYSLGTPAPSDQASALTAAAGLEDGAAKAYLKMASSVGDPTLLQFLASIMGDEAQHAAVLRAATGQPPVASSFQSF